MVHLGKHFPIDGAGDKPVRFQFAELPCQHPPGDARQPGTDFIKVLRSPEQVPQHRAFPLTADRDTRGPRARQQRLALLPPFRLDPSDRDVIPQRPRMVA